MQRQGSITRFREDPSVTAFLLDAKSDSSGLNLINATHVMLCEPLVNAAIELQAIARVHRIGQQKPTSVWMYLVKDTVEESIYELSVKRRLEHVQSSSTTRREAKKKNDPMNLDDTTDSSRATTPGLGALNAAGSEAAVDAANSLELQQAPLSKLLVKGKGQGEMVAKDDLWSCLFGHASRAQGSANGEGAGFLGQDVDGVAAGRGGRGAANDEVGRFIRAEAAGRRRFVN